MIMQALLLVSRIRLIGIVLLTITCSMPSAARRLIDRLPTCSEPPREFSYSELRRQISEYPLHHIEGIWRFPASGTEIAIVGDRSGGIHADPDIYRIIVVRSDNRSLRAGTLMGLITPAAKQGEYDARIYTSNVGSTLTNRKRFTLTLSDADATLRFRQHKAPLSVNLWRLLPYLWRYTVYPTTDREKEADGCRRIYPQPTQPREPIYL